MLKPTPRLLRKVALAFPAPQPAPLPEAPLFPRARRLKHWGAFSAVTLLAARERGKSYRSLGRGLAPGQC